MPELLIAGAGMLVGLIVGRWWALLGSIAVGIWIGFHSDVELPSWFLGVAYAALSAVGIAVGIAVRRYARR